MAAAARSTGLPKRWSGITGSATRRSTRTKSTSRRAESTSSPMPTGRRASPAPISTRPTSSAEIAGREHAHAEQVERGAEPGPPLVAQADRDGHRGEQAEREVDVEHPAPRHAIGEEPAHERPDQRGHAPDAREIALHLRPPLHAVEIADDGHADRDQGARAQSLQGAEGDELLHAARQPGERRAEEEEREPRQVGGPAAQPGRRAGPRSASSRSRSGERRKTSTSRSGCRPGSRSRWASRWPPPSTPSRPGRRRPSHRSARARGAPRRPAPRPSVAARAARAPAERAERGIRIEALVAVQPEHP